MRSMSHWPIAITVGELGRAMSIATNAITFGLTMWRSIYIFRIDPRLRSDNTLTTKLVYSGNTHFFNLTRCTVWTILMDRWHTVCVGLLLVWTLPVFWLFYTGLSCFSISWWLYLTRCLWSQTYEADPCHISHKPFCANLILGNFRCITF